MNFLAFLALIAISFLSTWFVFKAILGSEYPIVPVSASNMSIFQTDWDSLKHPFGPTLHVGDLIVVQWVNGSTVRDAYPNSDILVFHSPQSDSSNSGGLVITRVVAREERNGIVYFRTKGDGVGVHTWPEMPSVSECDQWHDYRENYTWNGMISEKLLIGKVVFRVSWVGYVALFVQNPSGILVVVAILIIIIVSSLLLPRMKAKAKPKPKTNMKNYFETYGFRRPDWRCLPATSFSALSC